MLARAEAPPIGFTVAGSCYSSTSSFNLTFPAACSGCIKEGFRGDVITMVACRVDTPQAKCPGLFAESAFNPDSAIPLWLSLSEVRSWSREHTQAYGGKVFFRHWHRADFQSQRNRQATLIVAHLGAEAHCLRDGRIAPWSATPTSTAEPGRNGFRLGAATSADRDAPPRAGRRARCTHRI